MESATKRICFAHRHMTPAEESLWNYARSVSHETGVFHFNGSRIAKYEYVGTSKNTVYRLRDSLVSNGWLETLTPPQERGPFAHGEYRALSHQEWAKLHPGHCHDSYGNPIPNDDPAPATESSRISETVSEDAQAHCETVSPVSDTVSPLVKLSGPQEDCQSHIETVSPVIGNKSGTYPGSEIGRENGGDIESTTVTTADPPNRRGNAAAVVEHTEKPRDLAARVNARTPAATGPRIVTPAVYGSAGADCTGGCDDEADPDPPSILSQRTTDASQQLGNLISYEYDLRDGVGRKFFTAIQKLFCIHLGGNKEPFKHPTQKHREAAKKLTEKYGVDRFLFAVCLFLKDFWDGEVAEDALVYDHDENGERLYKSWPLHEFISQGFAEEYLEKIKPYWGLNIVAMPWAIRNEINPKALTPSRIEAINFVHGFPFHEDGAFDAVYEAANLGSIDTPEEEQRFVQCLFDLKNRYWFQYVCAYDEIFKEEGISWDSRAGRHAKDYFMWQWEDLSDHPDEPPRQDYGQIREKLKAELVNVLGVQPDNVETPVCNVPLDDAEAHVFTPTTDGETGEPLILLMHV